MPPDDVMNDLTVIEELSSSFSAVYPLHLWNRLFCVKSTNILCSYVYADFLYIGNTYCPMKSPLYGIVDSGCSHMCPN